MRSSGLLDLRLAIPAAAAWVTAAVLQPVSPRVDCLVLATLVLTAVAPTMSRAVVRQPQRAAAVIVTAAAVGGAAGAAAMALHRESLGRGAVAALAHRDASADVILRLVRDPTSVTTKAGRRLTIIDATAIAARGAGEATWVGDAAPVTVFAVSGRWLGLLPGQRVIVAGRLRSPRPGDLVAATVLVSGDPRLIGRPPVWQRWAGRVRDALRQACTRLPADERGLVPGLVLGDVSAMPPDLTQAFRVTGLTHLNAVSGANCAIVLGAVAIAARRVGLRRGARVAVAALALAGFVILVRPSPSVLRAAVMGAVLLVGTLMGRRASPLPALSAAVLLLVVVDPFLARTPGFAMSVLATAAIVVLAPRWTDRLGRSMPRTVAAALAVPAAAQLACTPVLVAAFGQLTPLAVPANLLAAPAVAPATLAGIGCALVAVAVPSLAGWLAWPAGLAAGWLALVARTLAALPGAGLNGPRGMAGVMLVGAVLGGVAVLVSVGRRRRRRAILDTCPP